MNKYKHNRNKTFPPGFQVSTKFLDGLNNHSYAKITWVTNFEKTFLLHSSSDDVNQMFCAIKHYNAICEDVRNLEGFDDEPEDEVALLV